jgi:hypothetical protein
MKEYANVVKNCRIGEGKVLEYTRESTGGEAANNGASRSRGGTGRSHSMSSREDFLMAVTNLYLIPKKIYIR